MTVSGPGSRTQVGLKRLGHLLVVVIGWIGFVWLWLLVAKRPWESQGLMWLIFGSLFAAPLLTGAWVLHNRSLHRRKGERQAVATADMSYAQDWHGRSVLADWAALRQSRLVLISIEGERKLYHGSRLGGLPPAVPDAIHSPPPLAVAPRSAQD